MKDQPVLQRCSEAHHKGDIEAVAGFRDRPRKSDSLASFFGDAYGHGVADNFPGAQILVPDQVEPAS